MRTITLYFIGLLFIVSMGCGSSAPKGPKTIVVLGDSLTAGKGVSPDQAWPSVIQKKIDQEKWDMTIVNAGVSGDTTANGLDRLPSVIAAHETIDVFILALGANDILRRQSMTEMEQNLNTILDQVKDQRPEAKLIVAGVEFGLVLGMFAPKNIDDIFERVAETHRAELVPNLIKGVVGKPQLNVQDNIHPNEEGHKKIADRVWENLLPLL